MTPSEHPQTPPATSKTPASTGIQTPSTVAPAEGSSIALPPLPRPQGMDEAKFLQLRDGLDIALVVVVVLFAFLVASFPVYNPDFFRQLATGRLLLHGEYHFGVDPFVYSDDGTYWANHSWLFALLMYGIYHLPTIGGAAVVIFKAILIAALAGILMRASWRRGQTLWIPAACTALAILAASPRFFLQPVVLSYLFLGVTIWLLLAGQGGKRIGWLLVPLFALWVNCDAWFFLGPLTVGLYLVGELLQQQLSARAGEPQGTRRNELWTLGGIFVLGVAACLFNPHHVHALTLPPEFGLTAASDLLENDPQFRNLFYSPVRKEYYTPYFGLSVAGLAYWPLLLLSLASFALGIGRLAWSRLVVWIGFALLSFYNVRAIPYFAIVAGPILSLNCLDFIAPRLATRPPLTPAWRNGLLGGRIVTLLIGLALLIATVPGWLQAKSQPPGQRLLGWSVRPNPSLAAMARTIHAWRQAGRLPNDPHWFNPYTDVADYMAWFAPGERVFLDTNLLNFRKAAEDYLAIRKGFQQMVPRPEDAEGDLAALKTDWRQILRERKVHYWIFDNLRRGPDTIPDVILFTLPQQKEWVLCHLDGRLALFAWRDPKQPGPDPSQGLALDLKSSAFGPKAEQAPPRGEEPSPPRRWWETYWEAWWQPTPPLSSDRDLVGLYEIYYQWAEHPQLVEKGARAWRQGVAAGAIASSLPNGPIPNNLLAWSWCCTYHDLFPDGGLQPVRQPTQAEQLALAAQQSYAINGQFMETPSLYLSVRAARRALTANPDDGLTYFRLGQAYQRLRDLPQERGVQAFGSRLADMRRIQMTAAFQNCLRLPIDDDKAAQAHQVLAQVYYQRRYIDVAVHHKREELNKRMAMGVLPGVSPTDFSKNIDQFSAEVTRRESEVENLRNRYELTAAAKTGLDKVNVALELGLAETALEALEQAAADSVSTSNDMAIIKRVTAVLLDLGKLDRARELLPDPEGEEPVKPEEMDLYLNLAAARGDYEKADRLLEDALQHAWQPPLGQPAPPTAVDRLGLLVGQALLGEARLVMGVTGVGAEDERLTGIPSMPVWPNDLREMFQRPFLVENASDFWLRRWRYLAIITGLDIAQQHADLYMLRGWLALEAGHCDEAHEDFRAVLDNIVSEKSWVPEVNKLNPLLFPEPEIRQIQQLNFRHTLLRDLSERYLKWLPKQQR
jgi:tetratricopeptide (TPR) repeat protein